MATHLNLAIPDSNMKMEKEKRKLRDSGEY